MKRNLETLILTVADIKSIIRHVGVDMLMDRMIANLRIAIKTFNPTSTIVPTRDGFEYHRPVSGLLEWMPVMQLGQKATVKMVGYHPENPRQFDVPTILSTILVFDTRTGHMLGIADGTFLTAFRTGAASAVASEALASPNSRTLGLIGCGAQGVSQLHALSRIFNFDEVLIVDSDPEIAGSFARRAGFIPVKTTIAPLEKVVAMSDIICTATSVEIGKGPVFQYGEMKPHLHINAVGSDFPGKVEIPKSVLLRSVVVPDFPVQCQKEGECQQLRKDQIGPGLIELLQHPEKYEFARHKLSVFDSTGWALEDQVAMELVMEYAQELSLGQRLQLESIPADPHNPYDGLLPGVDGFDPAARNGKVTEPSVKQQTNEKKNTI